MIVRRMVDTAELDKRLQEIYDELDKAVREIAEKIGNVKLVVASVCGNPVASYSDSPLSEDELNAISSLLDGTLEGLQTLFTQVLRLNLSFENDFLFLESPDSILVLLNISGASLLVHASKPVLLGTVRAVIKSYLPKIKRLLDELQNLQNRLLAVEALRKKEV